LDTHRFAKRFVSRAVGHPPLREALCECNGHPSCGVVDVQGISASKAFLRKAFLRKAFLGKYTLIQHFRASIIP